MISISKVEQAKSVSKSEMVVIGQFDGQKPSDLDLDNDLKDKITKALKIEDFKGQKNKSLLVYGSGSIKRVLIYGLGKKKDYNSSLARNISAKLFKKLTKYKLTGYSVMGQSFSLDEESILSSFVEGAVLSSYQFLEFKSDKKKKAFSIKRLELIGDYSKNIISKSFILSASVCYSRDLGNLPANVLTPEYFSKESKKLSKGKNFKIKVIDVKQFEKLGLNSFYGVARGSRKPAKMIIVEYKGNPKSKYKLGLIGKGLTFDTGGISIKPSPRMDEMKFDMCGGATVMGLLRAVSLLKPKTNIVFAVGATENMPDGDAQRPGDIVRAYNGKTIEVLNTDAEGRLVLADVLSYVDKNYKPSEMIDFATLTGAVLVALGNRASGIMGNNEKLLSRVKSSAESTDEKVWELPLWDEYSNDIKGKYADIQNIGSNGAGTITAGAFLKEFVGNTPWVHMDIAGTAWGGPKEICYEPNVGASGVAVRLIYNLLESSD